MDYEQLAADVVARARKAGADEADVYLQVATEFSVQVRRGEIETLTQAGGKGLGLRVFVDKRQSFASTSDFSPEALEQLAKTTVALAASADQKPENGLAEAAEKPPARPELKLYDPTIESVPTEEKIALAKACEASAFAADPRISNSEGAGFGSGVTFTVLANSRGVVASYHSSGCSLFCQPLAEENGKKQVDYEWSFRRAFTDLESPDSIGRKAAERVVRKLGARKVPTQTAPVVFDRRVAARIWRDVLAAVNGDAVYKGMSFLKDKLGEKIAAESVTLIDDGTLVGGAGSAPFDGDGLPTRRNVIIENGVLKMFQYDTTTARKVGGGAKSTHNARRSYNGVPGIGPFNLFLMSGNLTLEEIIAAIPNGFFVTDMMGRGGNSVTGDFSTGASGLWIQDGALAYPVEEVTIAGTMEAILQGIERIGTDLIFNSSIASPTLQIAEMTIAGT
ncbi:MAG TPA: TldD/PmbA family protein [Chthonomonadaceae bacterium]|nr:TldD/PmbA family protein [Chthonomonadaceae bacterium]